MIFRFIGAETSLISVDVENEWVYVFKICFESELVGLIFCGSTNLLKIYCHRREIEQILNLQLFLRLLLLLFSFRILRLRSWNA